MKAHGLNLDSPAVRDFCRRWKITELSVFGSILRNDFRPDSDVDFLLDYEEDAEWDLFASIRMQNELAAILGRKVDVVDRYAIEHDGNRFIRQQILDTAERIYGRG